MARTTPTTRRTTTARKTRTAGAVTALTLAAGLALGACSGADMQGPPDAASSSAPDSAASSSGDLASATVDTSALPDPVAEVNGAQISKDDFVAAFEPQRETSRQQAQAGGAPLDEEALRDGVLDALVGSELLRQEGERLGLEASAEEVDAELDALAEQNGASSREDLLTMLEEQGVDEATAREEVGRLVVMDEILAERGDVEPPTEQELKDYYEELTGGADGAAATGGAEQVPAFEDVRDQLEQQLTRQQEDEALSALVEQLRVDAEITSHL